MAPDHAGIDMFAELARIRLQEPATTNQAITSQ
jgi:hypothetical protein